MKLHELLKEEPLVALVQAAAAKGRAHAEASMLACETSGAGMLSGELRTQFINAEAHNWTMGYLAAIQDVCLLDADVVRVSHGV